jgi:predicted nucleotidyltransferase
MRPESVETDAPAERDAQGLVSSAMIQWVAGRIAEKIRPEKIVLFGSYARGSATPNSDLDLLVVVESDLPRPARSVWVRRAFQWIPTAMDVLVYSPAEIRKWREAPASLVAAVERDGVVLYERDRH